MSKWQATALRWPIELGAYFPGHDLNLILRFSMYHQTRILIQIVPKPHAHRLTSFS